MESDTYCAAFELIHTLLHGGNKGNERFVDEWVDWSDQCYLARKYGVLTHVVLVVNPSLRVCKTINGFSCCCCCCVYGMFG